MIRALLGGSFDPFHNGHLAMVQAILARELADLALVVPAWQSPHKAPAVAAAFHRLHMAELALAVQSQTEVSACEVERGGVSYTVDTLEELHSLNPQDGLCLAVGADNLDAFFNWRRPERILELARLIVFARGDWAGDLPEALASRATVVRDFEVPISATAVRAELAAGRWPEVEVPGPVMDYIARCGLYGCDPAGRGRADPERNRPCP